MNCRASLPSAAVFEELSWSWRAPSVTLGTPQTVGLSSLPGPSNRNRLTGHMPGFWFNHFQALVLWKVPQGSSLLAHMVKSLSASAGDIKRHNFNPWVGKIPWRRKLQPIPIFLPGDSHGQRSLAGCHPWGHKESDMTKWLTLSLFNWFWCVARDEN